MKKLVLILALLFTPSLAFAQCNGNFGASTFCGTVAGGAPGPVPFSSIIGNAITALTGDGTAAGPGSVPLTLATVNSNVGTFGSTTQCNTITVNAKGLITAASAANCAPALSQLPQGIANSIWINPTGSTATMQNLAVPACANDGTHALVYVNSTGLQCATITGTTFPISAANGGTGVSSPTAHTIPINEGASAQANTGTGTTGQTLVSNGAGVDPSFKSGGWVLLNTITASSSATLSDTSNFTSTYNDYEIVFENVLPASLASCELQVHSGGSFQTSGYLGQALVYTNSASAINSQTTFIPCSQAGTVLSTISGISGSIKLYGPVSGSAYKQFTGMLVHAVTSAAVGASIAAFWNNTAVVDGFQLCFSSSTPTCNVNTASGVLKIYGRL